jgi:hypothetical protein
MKTLFFNCYLSKKLFLKTSGVSPSEIESQTRGSVTLKKSFSVEDFKNHHGVYMVG